MDLELDLPPPSAPRDGLPPESGTGPMSPRARRPLAGSTRRSLRDGPSPILSFIPRGPAGLLILLIGTSLLWSYWPTLGEMATRWTHDPRYSHGYLVPVFALYLLWSRRHLRSDHLGSRWMGVILIAAGCALRWLGAYCYISWFEAISLLVSLTGLVALCCGWAALPWAWPSLAFLIFMVPLPYRAETALGFPLQRMATEASTYALQVFGLPAFSSGNTIVIDDFRIGIIDACNGLGMSYMFLALSVAAAVIVRRPLADRLLLIASAIPIALAMNVARIVATGLLHVMIGRRVADAVYHDLAGWLMMLLALAILFVECRLLPYLFIETDDPTGTIPIATSEDGPRRKEPILSERQESRLIPWLVGIVLVVASGIIDGLWTNRWKGSEELQLAASHLDRVPVVIGDWKARAEADDPRGMMSAELQRSVTQRYENTRTGRTISLLLICGRPGPISVHTPEICYPAAGYQMAQAHPETIAVKADPRGGPAEFLWADFEQLESFPPERLRIYWSWKATGTWSVPYSARVAFGSQPFLYKLYLIHRTSRGIEADEDASFADFLQRLLPELDKALEIPQSKNGPGESS